MPPKTAEYCAQHVPDGMVNVCSRKCGTEGCNKQPSFGLTGAETAECCAQHAPGGMVDVMNRIYRTERCGVRSDRYKNSRILCAARTGRDGQRQEQICRTEYCGKQPSFGVAKSRTVEYCSQHARLQYAIGGFRKREIGPHHSGEETIANVIPGCIKHTTTVHPPPTKSNQPSGASTLVSEYDT